MRWHGINRAVLAVTGIFFGAAIAGMAVTGFAAPPVSHSFADNSPSAVQVDVELVLAVDISFSMDQDELELQREGYIQALTSREFLSALREGINAKIAVTYIEWAGHGIQHVVVPWRLIDGPETADAFAAALAKANYARGSRTSISGALLYAKPLFDNSGYRGIRRVIDISGDGANNHGPPVALTRDAVLASGITVNGLPIMYKRSRPGTMDIGMLDVYYEDCVIGGPGSFVVPIRDRTKFTQAIRTKLVLEIAGRQPEPRVIPVSRDKPRIDCLIGERLWRERWGRDNWN